MKNTMELVEEFKREYCKEKEEEVRQQEEEEDNKMFKRELPRMSQTSFGHNSTDTGTIPTV